MKCNPIHKSFLDSKQPPLSTFHHFSLAYCTTHLLHNYTTYCITGLAQSYMQLRGLNEAKLITGIAELPPCPLRGRKLKNASYALLISGSGWGRGLELSVQHRAPLYFKEVIKLTVSLQKPKAGSTKAFPVG